MSKQDKKVNTRIVHKHDIPANWDLAKNFIPKQGELIVYDDRTIMLDPSDESGKTFITDTLVENGTVKYKIGDGVTPVTALPFISDRADANLDMFSTNPVQNQAITAALYNTETALRTDLVNKIDLLSEISANPSNENVVSELGLSNILAKQDARVASIESGEIENIVLNDVENNIAVCKGYYWKKVDPSTRRIVLYSLENTERCIPTVAAITGSDLDTSFVSGYSVGDELVINNVTYYGVNSVITHIENNIITLDKLPFADIYETSTENWEASKNYYSVVSLNHPTEGYDIGQSAQTAMGYDTAALGSASVASGTNTIAYGPFSTAEGRKTIAGYSAHAEGRDTRATGVYSHAEGQITTAQGIGSHAEGFQTNAYGNYAHAEGVNTITDAPSAHSEGYASKVGGVYSSNILTAGTDTTNGAYAHAEGNATLSIGIGSHTEGQKTYAKGVGAHAEGQNGIANGQGAHAEGVNTQATNAYAHAEGFNTKATNEASHTEGRGTTASGKNSHAEGNACTAAGENSHAEGEAAQTGTSGRAAHAEGISTQALHKGSHAEGIGTFTGCEYQHVQGKYNKNNPAMAHIIGGGDSVDNPDNIHTVSWKGDGWYKGTVTATDMIANGESLVTRLDTVEDNIDTKIDKDFISTILPPSHQQASDDCVVSEKLLVTALADLRDDVNKNILDIPVTGGETENSAILNDPESNTVGCKGYYWKKICIPYGQIQLYSKTTQSREIPEEVTNVISTTEADVNFSSGYQLGDVLVINNINYYGASLEIVGIYHDIITVKELPFTAVNTPVVEEGSDWREHAAYYSIFCPDRPDVGDDFNRHSQLAAGIGTRAQGHVAVTEGYYTTAYGDAGHAEGIQTVAGYAAHAEGQETAAQGPYSHAEGQVSQALGISAHAEGHYTRASRDAAHAEGTYSAADGISSHAEGYGTQVDAPEGHAEGHNSKVGGGQQTNTLAIGTDSTPGAYAHAEGNATMSVGTGSHSEGQKTYAKGIGAHAEGQNSIANGQGAHAEGVNTQAIYAYAHAEGIGTQATNEASHAEGRNCEATAKYAHAEGNSCKANGENSHAEGEATEIATTGRAAHAEGLVTKALHAGSHVEGIGTYSGCEYQHVQGKYNSNDKNAAHIIGGGTEDKPRNIHTIDWDGNAWFAGITTITPKEIVKTNGKYQLTSTGEYVLYVGGGEVFEKFLFARGPMMGDIYFKDKEYVITIEDSMGNFTNLRKKNPDTGLYNTVPENAWKVYLVTKYNMSIF